MENQSPETENKMGVLPIKKLIVSMSFPMMISMLVQALYNIVDSIFVSKLSESALTAVTLAFPLQGLMIAVGSGTGVGINALLSRALGQKKFDESDSAANTGIFLAILSFSLFLLLGLFVAEPFIKSQSDNQEIVGYGSTYLKIVCILSIGLFFQMTFERLLQSTGQTLYSMISQLTGAVINIIFDPIMIFGLFGFPKLGIAGAAYATIFGQTVATVIGLTANIRKNKELHLSLKKILKPNLKIMGRIYMVGIPSILMMAIGSVMSYLMNVILIAFSETATAVFGAYFKLQSFFFMPVFGLNNGLIPVLAYNYGARKKDRIDQALAFSLKLAIGIMVTGTLIFELFPGLLLGAFNASDEMLKLGFPALRIIGIHFPIAAGGIIMMSIFQAFSKGFYSLAVSLCRQLLVLIPCAWLIATLTKNVNYVWWCYPIAEVFSFTLSLIFFRLVYNKIVKKL